MNYRLKCKCQCCIIKPWEENIVINLHELALGSGFLDTAPKAQVTKEKSRQTRIHQSLKFLCLKGHHPENEKTACRMGEDICSSYIC